MDWVTIYAVGYVIGFLWSVCNGVRTDIKHKGNLTVGNLVHGVILSAVLSLLSWVWVAVILCVWLSKREIWKTEIWSKK